MIQVEEEYLTYTPLSCFAEVGGYIGILLGMSVSDLVPLILRLLAALNTKGISLF